MSCFPQTELSHTPSISKAQPTIIKPDIRSAMNPARGPTSLIPFQADVHNFVPKMQDIASAIYGLPYGSPGSAFPQGLPGTQGVDPAAFYNSLSQANKDLPRAWRNPNLSFPTNPYDLAMAPYLYQGGFPHLALAEGVRGRKNATRETTSMLKTWLDDHKKNPYPTKGEKIMLAIISKMTLTQVSTWFANARRRLKKENKMTWSPRNCVDERDSGDDTPEHGFSLSPRAHDAALENNRIISPTKDNSASPQLPELKDGAIHSVDLPYQQYQQQMLLRQLALLPPHLRTHEALKHVQEQMHLRSRWAATAASESESRSTVTNYVSPSKLPSSSEDKMQQRRNSVGSPSTSSYDRSPSPSHRSLPTTCWAPASTSDQGISFRKSASVSDSPSDSFKCQDESASGDRLRTKSTEEPRKVKPSIWSPVSMVGEASGSTKPSILNSKITISQASSSSATKYAAESAMKLAPFSNDMSLPVTSAMTGLAAKPNASPSIDSAANYQAVAHYLREYQRQFASQNSLQPGLSPLMMPLSLDKTQQALGSKQILEQLQRHHNLQTQLLFSNNGFGKESANHRSHDSDVEIVSNDTPMNLSKSSGSPDMSLPLNLKEKKDFALTTDSPAVGTV